MQEIKFRGKAECSIERLYELGVKHDNGWVYGIYIDGYIINEVVDATDEYIAIGSWIPVHKETVGQYTGLKDKNDKEIYDGDIVKYFDNKEHIVVVENIKELGTGMYLKRVGSGYYTLNPSVIRDYEVEVIGNIHDNPELLEVV